MQFQSGFGKSTSSNEQSHPCHHKNIRIKCININWKTITFFPKIYNTHTIMLRSNIFCKIGPFHGNILKKQETSPKKAIYTFSNIMLKMYNRPSWFQSHVKVWKVNSFCKRLLPSEISLTWCFLWLPKRIINFSRRDLRKKRRECCYSQRWNSSCWNRHH